MNVTTAMLVTLLTIWALYLGAMISPGPNIFLVTQLAAGQSRRSAMFAGVGVAVGAAIWATCAVLGINVIFRAFPWLRLSLQIAGGLYLLYVAYSLWRSRSSGSESRLKLVPAFAAFRLGLLTNITNPKAALFFGSVFAAAFPSKPSVFLQVAAVLIVLMSALCWYALLSQLFSTQNIREGYSRIRTTANRIASVVIGSFGAGLLITSVREVRNVAGGD